MILFSASAAPYLALVFSICFPIPTFSARTVSAPVGKPVIAIVPAAWHAPIHYREYTDQLQHAGYDTVTQRLPSTGSSDPNAQSVAVDAAFIRQNMLMPSIDAGREVVLVMHSYSGGPGSMAAKGLSVTERRAAGKPGGIIGLIYICAFVAKEGQSLLDGSGGKFAPWVIEYGDGQLGVRDAGEIFFNDVPRGLSNPAVTELQHQARRSAETVCGAPAWADAVFDGRRAYVLCALDKAIPLVGQNFMIQQSGVQWDVKTFHTGHAPFLSQPEELSAWTIAEILKFKGSNGQNILAQNRIVAGDATS